MSILVVWRECGLESMGSVSQVCNDDLAINFQIIPCAGLKSKR